MAFGISKKIMLILNLIFRIYFGIKIRFLKIISNFYAHVQLSKNNCTIGKKSLFNGIPIIEISKKSLVIIGNNFSVNSGNNFNQIGRNQPSYIVTYEDSKLIIGNNVGISSTAIICFNEIIIEDNVKIGGNTVIYDSDFHSLNVDDRCNIPEIRKNIICKPIQIKRNVFIGAHSTILKGVVIGQNSIIGAGSVVRCSIPNDEIWAGNPAVFIKKISK